MSSDTSNQEEAIGQFCGVTGADEETAKRLLDFCDWNLDLAIGMHVDTDDGRNNKPSTSNSSAGPSTSNPPLVTIPDEDSVEDEKSNSDLPIRFRPQAARRAPNYQNNANNFEGEDGVRPPIRPVRQVLVQHPADLPPRRYNSRTGVTSDVFDAFRDFQAEAQWQESVQDSGSSTATPDSPTNTYNAHKRRTLEELFRPPLELMHRGSLESARERGIELNRWLLVNIQNGREFSCQTLNRDVWSNQTVKDILKEHFVFWQVYHDSFCGSRYTQFYNVTCFPHVAIIDPRTGEQMKSWPSSIDHNSFCDSVIEFLTEHPSPDGRDQKEEEIEKTKEKENNINKKEVIEIDDEKDEPVEEIKEQELKKEEKEKAEEIEDFNKYLGKDTEKFSDLVVRFPDGTRDQFKFPSDSLLKALFLLLTSRGYGMNQYNYVTNFPRRLLHQLPSTDTLRDAKLVRETIFVERRNVE